MKRLVITAVLLMAPGLAIAQTDQPQGTASQVGNDAKDAAGAVKKGAETGYSETKKGVETGYSETKKGVKSVYGGAKKVVTGSPDSETAAQDQTSTTSTPDAAPSSSTQEQNTTTTTSSNRLPQTASPLPLLGMLGLSSVSFGLWKFRFGRK